MKIYGTSGKISNTLKLHIAFGALQFLVGSLQLIQGLMSPQAYIFVAAAITAAHSGIGWMVRTQTSEVLRTKDEVLNDVK